MFVFVEVLEQQIETSQETNVRQARSLDQKKKTNAMESVKRRQSTDLGCGMFHFEQQLIDQHRPDQFQQAEERSVVLKFISTRSNSLPDEVRHDEKVFVGRQLLVEEGEERLNGLLHFAGFGGFDQMEEILFHFHFHVGDDLAENLIDPIADVIVTRDDRRLDSPPPFVDQHVGMTFLSRHQQLLAGEFHRKGTKRLPNAFDVVHREGELHKDREQMTSSRLLSSHFGGVERQVVRLVEFLGVQLLFAQTGVTTRGVGNVVEQLNEKDNRTGGVRPR